ncbi:slipin family protein [Sphingobacterium hungaricum]|uniref:Peptidase n=1 Tax=Sphingobacterium hungaricum TaxID=2082723 RepID=A0A928UXW3_9SPHI|nr:slipin family protein [Sphingobacterium hungaricum]MBE8712594.1 peptidase [Sphingobacterium hungaricum]
MKRVTINTNYVGLVFKNGEFKRVLKTGNHWLWFGEKVILYDLSKDYYFTNSELDGLLQHNEFTNLIDLILVGDNELVLVYQNGNFKSVLTAGRHVIWKALSINEFVKVNTDSIEIDQAINKNLLDKAPLLNFIRAYKIESFEKGLLFIDGKFDSVLDAGNYVYWKNSTMIQVLKADTRQLTMEIIGQEILTKDKAQLRLNFSVQYKVEDIIKALLENKDFEKQLYITIQLALRECIGLMTFDELMEGKEKIAEMVMSTTIENASALGVKLVNCGVKDIVLPGDVKEIMNQVLVAEKRAQANIITRREETASTRSLLNTAKLMEDNAMLYKLKEMEYVEKIAEKINTISLSGSGQIVDQLKQIFVK